jgi:voltage-gated potassium channel
MKQDVLQQVDLFQEAPKSFRQEIARHLQPEVLTPGGYVCREGDEGDKVYFIVRGKVEVLEGPESRKLSTLGPGEFFGEISLFTEGPRTASVRALEFTEVYWLSRNAFRQVTARYPTEVKPIEEIARARQPGAMRDSDS